MKKQFLSYFSVLFFTFSFAQDKVIEGHVFELVSEDSISPLPGVNVLFQGSTNGTTTNTEGTNLFEAVCSLRIIIPIKVANIILLSRKDETYAIGKYCIHQTTIPYVNGANIPNKTPVKIRFLLL